MTEDKIEKPMLQISAHVNEMEDLTDHNSSYYEGGTGVGCEACSSPYCNYNGDLLLSLLGYSPPRGSLSQHLPLYSAMGRDP